MIIINGEIKSVRVYKRVVTSYYIEMRFSFMGTNEESQPINIFQQEKFL